MARLVYWLLNVAVFFAVFKFWGIYPATVLMIVGAVGEIGWFLARRQRISRNSWVGYIVLLLLAVQTFVMRDPIFVKWSPTSFYGLAAISLLGSVLLGRSVIYATLGHRIDLPGRVWSILDWTWIAVLTLLASVNVVVAYTVSTEVWVNWRIVGAPGVIAVVLVAQAIWLRRPLRAAVLRWRADSWRDVDAGGLSVS